MPFVWGYATHRISKSHLQKLRDCGGLGLPSLMHYDWAANVRVMLYWQYGFERGDGFIPPPWLAIEKSLTHKTSLPALLFLSPSPPLPKGRIVLFCQILRGSGIKLENVLCSQTPRYMLQSGRNHAFLPSLTDTVFREWSCMGIA